MHNCLQGFLTRPAPPPLPCTAPCLQPHAAGPQLIHPVRAHTVCAPLQPTPSKRPPRNPRRRQLQQGLLLTDLVLVSHPRDGYLNLVGLEDSHHRIRQLIPLEDLQMRRRRGHDKQRCGCAGYHQGNLLRPVARGAQGCTASWQHAKLHAARRAGGCAPYSDLTLYISSACARTVSVFTSTVLFTF